ITSYSGPFYPNALHPYTVLTEAGFTVDLASETGHYGMDPHSISKDFMNDSDFATYNDPNNEFSKKLAHLYKASELNPEDYGLFFASAGHATLFDYPTAKALIGIAESVWARGGVVSAVCHGPAILPSIKDRKTGKSVTGFTDEGEEMMDLMGTIREFKLVPISQSAKDAGATYVKPKTPFEDFAVTDGACAHSTAVEAVKAFAAL
ncbi:class I glutamine amidotransferase-like protein, partial [Kickxella alabastrina]|uniref:class I glutamine amidotransferase-like protein n=1 Tax=Kickxella alabastrina TaxID=61397 RepID=UPI00221E8969